MLCRGRIGAVLSVAVALFGASPGSAAVSCASPDALCTGNPCVTGALDVQSPCVVDFGNRALVINGAVRIANGGVLSLRAGSIAVRRPILGRHTKLNRGDGAAVTLTAAQNITIDWRIDVSARNTPGSITLNAGGNVDVRAPIRAAAAGNNPRAAGGALSIDAGGTIRSVHRARMRLHGDIATPGGRAVLRAGRGVHLGNRIVARGSSGGSIAVSTTAGSIVVVEPLEVNGTVGDGGVVSLVAAAGSVTTLDRINAEGIGRGGSISLIGGKPVTTNAELRARSRMRALDGGTVVIASNEDITVGDTVYATGRNGGAITVIAQHGAVRVNAPLTVAGARGVGGTISLIAGPQLVLDSIANADGMTVGGSVAAAAIAIQLTGRSTVFARGDKGGTIDISGERVVVVPGAHLLVDGSTPGGGSIRLAATAGDLILAGDFRARGRMGGRIEGAASGDVIASGDFTARGQGCIGLSAGSTLNVSGGAFDVPITSNCP